MTADREPRKPTAKQVYLITRLCLELAGAEFPETTRDASALIDSLQALQAERAARERAAQEVPF